MFYFTCNESKLYESFTFWIVRKFSRHSNSLRCTCVCVCVCIYIYIRDAPILNFSTDSRLFSMISADGKTDSLVFFRKKKYLKRHLCLDFCDKIYRIWKLRLCFLSEVTKHKAGCDDWIGGILQIMLSEGKTLDLATLSIRIIFDKVFYCISFSSKTTQ